MPFHKRGRPRSEYTTSNLSVRLTDAEREALQSHVDGKGEPAAVLIRTAMEAAGLFEPYEEKPATKRRKKTTEGG